MADPGRLGVCREHHIPLFYRGDTCPWCEFTKSMTAKVVEEYKRGFEDGAKAVLMDLNKQREEERRVQQRSGDSEGKVETYGAVPANIPGAFPPVMEPDSGSGRPGRYSNGDGVKERTDVVERKDADSNDSSNMGGVGTVKDAGSKGV